MFLEHFAIVFYCVRLSPFRAIVAFASASPGYLLNPDATSDCQYCAYSSGDQYLSTLSISADEKWRDFGVFLVFVMPIFFVVLDYMNTEVDPTVRRPKYYCICGIQPTR